jgi:Protein of unknown function (DUF3307)
MEWTEIFGVLVVSHLAGDFLLQTEWQARHKRGGLGPDPVARRALVSHVLVYGLAFVPAFVWLAGEIGAAVLGVAALILLPHLVQDDGRAVSAYMSAVKRTEAEHDDPLFVIVDQSFHLIALFLVALVASG